MIAGKISYFRLVAQLFDSVATCLFRPRKISFDDVVAQMRVIGVGAIPAASLIASTTGFVLALVLEVQLSRVGKVTLIPPMIWSIVTEQVVPVGVAFIFVGRSVSAVTAELGSMQISEEIKALFTMGIDMGPYLLLPRFLGFQIMLPVVTLIGIYAALAGGWVLCALTLGMGIEEYVQRAMEASSFTNVLLAIAKSAVFGFLAATIAFYKGLNVRQGSREISAATTQSVIGAIIAVTMANAALTALELI